MTLKPIHTRSRVLSPKYDMNPLERCKLSYLLVIDASILMLIVSKIIGETMNTGELTLVTNEPVEVQDFEKITDHFKEI